VAAAAEVVLARLDHHAAPDHRVRPNELHQPVLGAAASGVGRVVRAGAVREWSQKYLIR
jgi:hypothetical protein